MMTTGTVYGINRPGDHVEPQKSEQPFVDAERLAALEAQAKKNEELINQLMAQTKAQLAKVEESVVSAPVEDVKAETVVAEEVAPVEKVEKAAKAAK